MLRTQHAKETDGVGNGEHGRTQGADARLDVCAGAHTLVRRTGARLLAGHDVVVTHDGGCLSGRIGQCTRAADQDEENKTQVCGEKARQEREDV